MLTERQQQILDWIVAYTNDQGRVPAIREIMDAFGMKSPNGVVGHLKALRKKGYLGQHEGRTSRCLTIVSDDGFEVVAGPQITVRVDRPLSPGEVRRLIRKLREASDLAESPVLSSGNGSISAIEPATLVCNEAAELEAS